VRCSALVRTMVTPVRTSSSAKFYCLGLEKRCVPDALFFSFLAQNSPNRLLVDVLNGFDLSWKVLLVAWRRL
jgi:hypothetical protein